MVGVLAGFLVDFPREPTNARFAAGVTPGNLHYRRNSRSVELAGRVGGYPLQRPTQINLGVTPMQFSLNGSRPSPTISAMVD